MEKELIILEEDYDIEAYNESMEEFEKNPNTYTLDEVAKELGLDADN